MMQIWGKTFQILLNYKSKYRYPDEILINSADKCSQDALSQFWERACSRS